MNALSIEEKVGQLFVVPIYPPLGERHIESVCNLLKERHIGFVIFMEGDSSLQREVLQRFEREGLKVRAFQDAEWGVGMRLGDIEDLPKNLTLGAITDLGLLEEFGREVARGCLDNGIQGNFAPVVDINSNPDNPVIGRRSFGDDPFGVAMRAKAVMKGMQEGGIWTCVKHFPGHGDTLIDSHLDLPRIDLSLEEMLARELIPFEVLINEGVDLVMIGHLLYPKLSEEISSLSYEIITDLLRNQLGFHGVVITDALNMKAIVKNYSLSKACQKALNAGVDLLLVASNHPAKLDWLIRVDIPRAIDHVMHNVEEEIIDRCVDRVLRMPNREKKITFASENLKERLFSHAVTQEGELQEWMGPIACVGDKEFAEVLSQYAPIVSFSFEEMDLAAEFSDLIVQISPNTCFRQIPDHAVIALFDLPYRLRDYPNHCVVIGYEDNYVVKEIVAKVLFHKIPALGKLPIQVYRGYGQSTN